MMRSNASGALNVKVKERRFISATYTHIDLRTVFVFFSGHIGFWVYGTGRKTGHGCKITRIKF